MDHPPSLQPPVGPADHVQGSAAAAVTLVEFGDYECPACGEAYAVVKRLEEAFGERLRFVFREYPLRALHPNAELAAEAAEAAAEQGKFWEMHDTLYEHQDNLDAREVVLFVDEVGLDLEQMRRSLADGRAAARVQRDVDSGERSGVRGTPTFYINGSRYDGSYEFEDLAAAIQKAPKR